MCRDNYNKNIFYKKLNNLLNLIISKAIKEKIFSCASISISIGSGYFRELFFYSSGTIKYKSNKRINKDYFFDIASLTKPLATTLSILSLIKEKKIYFDSKIENILGKISDTAKKDITIRNLLNHTSGLPAHKEYFKDIKNIHYSKRKDIILHWILSEKMESKKGDKQIYSDLGFILLGMIVEKVSGMGLDRYTEEKIYQPLNIEENIFFNRFNRKKGKKLFVPTERCRWRKKTLCGQVHDDNSYALGGVSGQAGLFANIYGVTDLVNALVDIAKGFKYHPNIERDDLIKSISNENPLGTWRLGFDSPAGVGSSSGRYFTPKNSFGHLGFTGTSFWVDMEKDIAIVLLTNRVHPDRENNAIKRFRPLFHDAIMKEIMNGPSAN